MKRPTFPYKKSSWFRSYAIITFSIIVVLLIYSAVIVTQVRQEVDQNNIRFTNHYNAMTEKSLKSIQDYSATLLYADMAKRMHSYLPSDTNTPEALSVAYELVLYIRNYIITNNILEDMYVYYPESDLVIGRKGVFESYVYFKSERPSTLPMEQEYFSWKTQFDNKPSGFYSQQNANGQHTIYYFQKLISSTSDNKRFVVAKIGETQMNSVFQEMVSTSVYDYAALVDEEGNVYAQAGNNGLFLNEAGLFNYWQSSGRFTVCTAQSEQWPFLFVTIQDFNTAYQSVYRMIYIIIFSIIIAAVIGYILALFFTKRNQSAVERLAERFDRSEHLHSQADFDYIGSEIDKLIISNASAIEAAEQQQKLIHAFFLRDLLLNGSGSRQDVERLCSTCQISFENALFSLIILKPDQPLSNEDRISLDTLAASYADNNFFVCWAVVLERVVFLCNFEATTRLPQAPAIALAKELRDLIPCEAEISPLSDDASALVSFWLDTCGTSEPQITSPAVQMKRLETSLFQEFCMAIDQDDLTSAISLVSTLHERLSTTENEKLALCRKHMLLAKLYENYDTPQILQQLDALYNNDEACDWDMRLIALLQELEQNINRQIDTRQIAEIAKDIIMREYSNPQLSLQMIADKLSVSQSYLSRLFKGKYGVSVIHYLNRVRIDHAKELMRNSNDYLNVIAIQCGFTSSISLIRVFKKYENTTPGTFRTLK